MELGEGSVGSVFLDLVVRDTAEKQVADIAAKAQAGAKQSFAGLEQMVEQAVSHATRAASSAAATASRAAAQAAAAAQKAVQAAASSAASSGLQVEATVSQSFDKAVALARAKVAQLEWALEGVTAKLATAKMNDDDGAAGRLLAQQEAAYDRLVAARERLAIEVQAAAQRQAAAEAAEAQKAAAQQEAAAQQAAAQQAAVAEQAAQAQVTAVSRVRQGAAAAFRWIGQMGRSAFGALGQAAVGFRNMASRAFTGLRSVVSRLGKAVGSLRGRFSAAGKAAGGFGTRLKGIISGALVFNVLSRGLTKMVEYMGTALGTSEQLQDALADLKGAAATAAAPMLEVLAPALAALANGAATVLSYLSRMISFFTGKSVSAMSAAAKKIQTTTDAAKKAKAVLAGFDEIQRLDHGSEDSDSSDGKTPNYDFQGQSQLLEDVLKAVQSEKWEQVGQLFGEKINSLVAAFDATAAGTKLGQSLDGLVSVLYGFFTTTDFTGIGEKLGQTLTAFVEEVDWDKLGQTVAEMFISLPQVAVGAIMETDWAEVAKSLSEGLISAMDGISDWLEGVDWQEVGDQIASFFENIDWDGIATSAFELLGAAIGAVVGTVWGAIDEAAASIGEYFTEKIDEAGGDVAEGLLNGIVEGLKDLGRWIWDNICTPFMDGFKDAFGIHSPSTVMEEQGDFLIQGLLNGITGTWEDITKFFDDALADLEEALGALDLEGWASGAWEGIKEVFGDVGKWFEDTFSDAWESIVDVFSDAGEIFTDIKDGVVSGFKSIVNKLIDGINSVVSVPFNGINDALRTVRDISIFGMSPFSGIQTISVPQIPKLADGGVIRQPTLAMMGEYAGAGSDPEIAAPQSLMRQTMEQAMGGYSSDMVQCCEAIVSVLEEILAAVMGIELDGHLLYDKVEAERAKLTVVRGGAW